MPRRSRKPTMISARDYSDRVLKLDPSSAYASIELLTFITSSDRAERREALATYGSAILGNVGHLAETTIDAAADPTRRSALVGRMNILGLLNNRPDFSERLKQAKREEIFEVAEFERRQAHDKLFVPHGGHSVVAIAPGLDAIIERIMYAIDHGAVAAALQVIMVCRLHLNHTTLTASLARAATILEKTHIGSDRGTGTDRTQKEYRKDFQRVAHIWAAVMMAGGYPWGQSGLQLDKRRLVEGILDGVTSEAALKNAIAYSKWFWEFLSGHKPPKASAPTLDVNTAFEVRSNGSKSQPPLLPLNDQELDAAKGHESYTMKHSDID